MIEFAARFVESMCPFNWVYISITRGFFREFNLNTVSFRVVKYRC